MFSLQSAVPARAVDHDKILALGALSSGDRAHQSEFYGRPEAARLFRTLRKFKPQAIRFLPPVS